MQCQGSLTTYTCVQRRKIQGSRDTIDFTDNMLPTNSSVVTITGLSHTGASSSITLMDRGNDGETIFWDGTTQGTGAWSSDTLTLKVYTGMTLSSGTMYTFASTVTNPSYAQLAPVISIAASSTADLQIRI